MSKIKFISFRILIIFFHTILLTPLYGESLQNTEFLTDLVPNEPIPIIGLGTVVVTAAGFAQDVKDAPASISVITQEDLKTKPFSNMVDALRGVPGVSFTAGGGGLTDISIRGMGPSYTMFMVDGKRQNSRETRFNNTGGIEQGWMPPLSAIERIEVIRGPMSSLYGSEAMGGVINIITKKVATEWGGSMRMESTVQEASDGGNNNSIDLYLSGPLIKDQLGLQIFGKYLKRDEDKFIGGNPLHEAENIGGKLTYTPNSNHTFEFESGVAAQKRNASKGMSDTQDVRLRTKRTYNSLRHQGTWGSRGITSDLQLNNEITKNLSSDVKLNNMDLVGSIIIPLTSHMFTLGGQYRKERLDDANNQSGKDFSHLTRWSYAFFIEDEWQITERFALTGGLRMNNDEKFGLNWNPRLYGVWSFTDTFTLKGGVSTGFTAPQLRYVTSEWGQNTGGRNSYGYIYGNPGLKPEESTNYEISLNYANDNGLTGSITGFYSKFKNKIQSVDVCRDPNKQYTCLAPNGQLYELLQERENIDNAVLKGIELTSTIPLRHDLSLTGNYTWTKTEQKSGDFKGQPLNRVPDHQVDLSLNWRTNERLNIWMQGRYIGKESSAGRNGPTRYPSYSTFDLGGSYAFNEQNTLYAGIYNVADKRMREGLKGRLMDGRRYWLGLNIDF